MLVKLKNNLKFIRTCECDLMKGRSSKFSSLKVICFGGNKIMQVAGWVEKSLKKN